MTTTRRRKAPIRSVVRRRVQLRKSRIAKRLKTQKRKLRNMKGGIYYPYQYSRGNKITDIDGTDWHVYLISNQKDFNTNGLQNKFIRFPFCYVIRKKETIGKDPIYLIFRNNCTNDDIRQILQIAFEYYQIKNVRIDNPTKDTSPIVSTLEIESEKSKALLDKILSQYDTDTPDNTDTQDNGFRSRFIKIHGTRLAGYYKFVSTGIFKKEQFSTMKISELKDIPTTDNELTEEERKQILSADRIITRLEYAYKGRYVQKSENADTWQEEFDNFSKITKETPFPDELREKMYPTFQPYNSYFPCSLIQPLLGQDNDTIKKIHDFVISDDDVKVILELVKKPQRSQEEIDEEARIVEEHRVAWEKKNGRVG